MRQKHSHSSADNSLLSISDTVEDIPTIEEVPEVPQSEPEEPIFEEQAISFITFDSKDQKFHINPEAEQMISQLEGPIGICAVAGMYRTGKSYLLNRMLLDRSSGFGVGPTINPCTKGLWIWNKPIDGQTADGEKIKVLVVDTEGLGAFDESQTHDIRIFSLAILLSSYFVYNSMGSIDENSLNQLSLVVNLTKHIQLKANGAVDIDPEDYAKLFPSFMWVVRDFSLQLMDPNNCPITSRQYLEMALKEQKGLSDSMEAKNRIRRLLKTFFKERDCQTLIRPLVKEKELQNLANMQLKELRPDFVEQVMALRKKVLFRIKPKMLNGKQLSGPVVVGLARQYVDSINKGNVPNIESAWTYICQTECVKALAKSIEEFASSLDVKLPCDSVDLAAAIKDAKSSAFLKFTSLCIGGPLEEFKLKLKDAIKQKKTELIKNNDRECVQICNLFLIHNFKPLEMTLKNNQFETLGQFQEALKQFEDFFVQNAPPGNQQTKSLVCKEFIAKISNEAAYLFLQTQKNEFNLQQQLLSEKAKHLQSRIDEIKADSKQSKEDLEEKVRIAQSQLADVQVSQSITKDLFENLKIESRQQLTELSDELQREKKMIAEQLNIKEIALQSKEQAVLETQRQLLSVQSEHEKQNALLMQKADFLERTIADKDANDVKQTAEIKAMQKRLSEQHKEITAKFEQQLREANNAKYEADEKVHDLQSSLESLEQRFQFEQQRWTEQETDFKSQLDSTKVLLKSIEEKEDGKTEERKQRILDLEVLLEEMKSKNADSLREMETKLSEQKEESSYVSTKLEKEIAVLQQKIEFQEVQNAQLTSQLSERQKTQDKIIKAIESKAQEQISGKQEAEQLVRDLREKHFAEIDQLKRGFEEVRTALEIQIESINTEKAEKDLHLKLSLAEQTKEIQQLKQQLQVVENERNSFEKRVKTSNSKSKKKAEELAAKYQNDIVLLETELEEAKRSSEAEIESIQAKTEEQLAQLRIFYEEEKDRQEQRISGERDRALKKLVTVQEEYERRLVDEQTAHEDDVELLHDERRESEQRHMALFNQVEHENSLLKQKLDSVSQQIEDKESRFQTELSVLQGQLDTKDAQILSERRNLEAKQEQLQTSLSAVERELTTAKISLDSLMQSVERKQKQFEQTKSTLEAEKAGLLTKCDELKEKNQVISDEYLQRQLEDGRELALHKQKCEFQEKKISEQQLAIEESMVRYEDRILQQKKSLQAELSETAARIDQAKSLVEQKFDQKRKAFKDAEMAYQKRLTETERERALLSQQLQNETKVRETLSKRLETEQSKLKESVQQLTDTIATEREAHHREVDRIRSQLGDLEKVYHEAVATQEREKALYEGKVVFLVQQRDQAKADLADTSRKFDATIEQLQKRGHFEKDKNQSSNNALLKSLESKFDQQLKEKTEESAKHLLSAEEKLKVSEKQGRELSTQLQILQREMETVQRQYTRRTAEMSEREEALTVELSKLKSQRDIKCAELQRQLDRERESAKQRISECEQRFKEIESRRSTLLFEFEKERAKWNLEKDQLVGKTNECMEQIERLEHKKETLLRENEKLRSQSRNKTPLAGQYSTRQASSGAVGSSIMKASFNGQLLKTPTSFASRLKENGGSTTPTRAHGLFLGIQKANFSKDTEHLRLNTDALTSRENFSLTQRVGSSIRGGGFNLNGFGKQNFEQTSNAESKVDQENEMEFGSNK